VFNGCIYNFLELREELERCGQRFRSHSDTEVLLRGYREWGIDALAARLRGMFAFAIWDQPRRTLTLARDRLGVKPLIYCERSGEIAFASTVAALHAAGFGGGVDPQAVLDFLEFGYVTEERAIYEGISKLPPATILEWRGGQAAQRRYWTLPEPPESARVRFEDAVEETERLLVEAVRLRLISDVPVGALLSGGIDSALVCWAMRELNASIKAFTVRAPGDSSDESAEAAHTARVLGVSHEIVDMPEADFSLDEVTDAFSEPFSCASAQAMLWVSSAVKRQATVLLTGDGGDDVFLGYPFLRNAWVEQKVAQRLPAGAAAALRAVGGILPARGPMRRLGNFIRFATGGLGDRLRSRDDLPYYDRRSILGERLAGRHMPQRAIPASLEAARRLLSDALAYHRQVHFTGEFMVKVDSATMYYSLEARAPFLDQGLWEFAAALPPETHFHRGHLKAVLREIARRRIGPEVASRTKRGFTVPLERWLAERWSGMLDRLRGDTTLEREGWVRRGSLGAPLRDALHRREIPVQVWRLLLLEHWLEKNGGDAVKSVVRAAAPAQS
jgi:asparagine synthase (glutamine-hydrolysing)